ncbi:hypothetical protein BDR05DRAFT_952143 [Suillus weaverae]|nr:hypothetical protein BDR05DRAFT_952143 [Suillus weaverae]
MPNFHSASHLYEFINAYGPAYAWILGKANNNGHGSGELEGTFIRSWWKSILVQELLMHLQAQPEAELSDEDQQAILALLRVVNGGAEMDQQHGTLMNYIALLSTVQDSGKIKFPNQSKKISLRPLNIYPIILQFLHCQFPELNLTSDAGQALQGIPFNSHGAKSYATVTVGAAKYGSSQHSRGKGLCYSYIEGRIAT